MNWVSIRWRLVTCSVPGHCLNQCWLHVICTVRNKFKLNLIQNTIIYILMLFSKCGPFSSGLSMLIFSALWEKYSRRASSIDPSHKSHNASDKYPTMHHFLTKRCIVGYGSGALWDKWIRLILYLQLPQYLRISYLYQHPTCCIDTITQRLFSFLLSNMDDLCNDGAKE